MNAIPMPECVLAVVLPNVVRTNRTKTSGTRASPCCWHCRKILEKGEESRANAEKLWIGGIRFNRSVGALALPAGQGRDWGCLVLLLFGQKISDRYAARFLTLAFSRFLRFLDNVFQPFARRMLSSYRSCLHHIVRFNGVERC